MTNEQASEILDDYDVNFEGHTAEEVAQAFDCAFKALDQTRWIPVSERLPEEDCETYLVCTDEGYIATIMYDRSMGWLLDTNIIAYMPLPQPYTAESEEV